MTLVSNGPAVSNLGAFIIGLESQFGTPVARTDALQAVSDGFKDDQPEDVSKAIFNSSQIVDTVAGVETAGGNLVCPAYGGVGYGKLLNLASREVTSELIPGITAAPTIAAFNVPAFAAAPTIATGSTGTLPAGTWYYEVQPVYRHTQSGVRATGAVSAESAQYTSADGIHAATVTIPTLPTPPTGWVYDSTNILKTPINGGTTTEVLYDSVVGTGLTYTDNGTGVAPAAPAVSAFLPSGNYMFKTAEIWQNTGSGANTVMNWSPESAPFTADGSHGATVTSVFAGSQLPGFSRVGSAVAITPVGGGTGTEFPYDYQISASTAFHVMGSGNPSSTQTLQAAMHYHTLGPSNNQPPSCSFEKVMANGTSELYTSGMVDKANWSIAKEKRVESTFDFFAQTMVDSQTPSSPAYSPVFGFHGRNTSMFLMAQGASFTQAQLITGVDIALNNNLKRKWDCGDGKKFVRVIRAALREITGSLKKHYEVDDQLQNYLAKQSMHLFILIVGPSQGAPFTFQGNTTPLSSFRYFLSFDLPNIQWNGHTANLNADNPIEQTLPFVARMDPTAGYECLIGFGTTAVALT